jgi:hypothetical protein
LPKLPCDKKTGDSRFSGSALTCALVTQKKHANTDHSTQVQCTACVTAHSTNRDIGQERIRSSQLQSTVSSMKKELFMKATHAFVLIAALGLAGASVADDKIKSGGRADKPGRAIDGDTVKSGGRADEPGRAIDGETVKSGGRADKPGRAVDG